MPVLRHLRHLGLISQNKILATEQAYLWKPTKTRPSKQCKSLIWILVFVFPVLCAPPSLWFWSSEGQSSLQMTICKGTEKHGGGRIIQIIICNNPCSSIPLILVIWSTVLYANHICKGTEEAGSSRWSFATIPAPPSPWFWSSGEPSSLQMTICKGMEEHRGGRMI